MKKITFLYVRNQNFCSASTMGLIQLLFRLYKNNFLRKLITREAVWGRKGKYKRILAITTE